VLGITGEGEEEMSKKQGPEDGGNAEREKVK